MRTREAARFLLSTSVPAFLVLSLAGTKRGLYLFPIFPSLALLSAVWLLSPGPFPRWERRVRRGTGVFLVYAGLLIGAGSLAAPAFAPAVWPRAVAGGLVFGAAVWFVAGGLAGARPGEAWVRRAAIFALGVATALFVALPALDRVKSFVPFTDDVARIVPADAPLLALDPDETTLGVVGFYTGRRLDVVDTPEDLPAALAGRSRFVVVRGHVRDESGDLARLRAEGLDVRVAARFRVGNRRVMKLLDVAPSASSGPTVGELGTR